MCISIVQTRKHRSQRANKRRAHWNAIFSVSDNVLVRKMTYHLRSIALYRNADDTAAYIFTDVTAAPYRGIVRIHIIADVINFGSMSVSALLLVLLLSSERHQLHENHEEDGEAITREEEDEQNSGQEVPWFCVTLMYW